MFANTQTDTAACGGQIALGLGLRIGLYLARSLEACIVHLNSYHLALPELITHVLAAAICHSTSKARLVGELARLVKDLAHIHRTHTW